MAVTLGHAVIDYVAERTARRELTGQSPATVRKVLWLFATELGLDTKLNRVTTRRLERWLSAQRVSAGTLRHRISTVRTFFEWQARHGRIRVNPMSGVTGPRQPRPVPRGLRRPQVSALFRQAGDDRATLMISLMVQEGLRCCEVAALEVGDIDLDERSMLVRGKGGRERVLPVSDETHAAICAYLHLWPAVGGPLVRSYKSPGKALSAHYVSIYVGEMMHAAGIAGSAHGLRHTAATDMIRAGAHIRDVQAALGHASLQTTQRYLPLIVFDLRKAMGGRCYRSQPIVHATSAAG